MLVWDDFKDLYDYNAWANEEVRKVIGGLNKEAFSQDLRSSHRSLRGTVAHLASAEWIWLQRWKGISPGQMLSEEGFATPEMAVNRWTSIDQEVTDFVNTLKTSDLGVTFSFTTTEGKKLSGVLWQAMQHLVNHSSYHRGQIAALLRQLGETPRSTDLIKYYRLKAASV